MLKLSSTTRAIKNAKTSNKRQRDELTLEASSEREKAIAHWYREGGQVWIEWAKAHYRMSDGEPLLWDEPFLVPFFLAFGNPWFEKFVIEKAAQVGYTESLIAFCAFALAYLRSPIGLGFEAQRKVFGMVGKRIQPAFDHCEPIQQLAGGRQRITGRQDIDSKESITVAGVPLELFYAKLQATKEDDQAASGVRSFTVKMVCVDEFGLCEHGVLDVAAARMAHSDWPTKIVRAGSTPAIEGGAVDTEVRTAKYLFEWQIGCPYCGEQQFLSAFGNFLKMVVVEEDGTREERFVDKMGRPLSWFHHSHNPAGVLDNELKDYARDEAIYSAYVGCQECAGELGKQDLGGGLFVCVKTGVTLQELCDRTLNEQAAVHETIAMRLPKLASKTFDAVERIRFMFDTKKPADGIQQFLGIATSLGGGKISLSRLKACVGLVVPETRRPDLVVAGLDQGRYQKWLLISRWWLADSNNKEIRWLDARKEIVEWREIAEFEDLDDLVRIYDIDLIGMDSEPEWNDAVKYALKHPPKGHKKVLDLDDLNRMDHIDLLDQLGMDSMKSILEIDNSRKGQVFLFDQMNLEGEQFRRTLRKIKSIKTTTSRRKNGAEKLVPVYLIDRTYWLDAVRDRIYRGLQHFPADYIYNPKDPSNLLYHYTTSDRLPDSTWLEPPGSPDHGHHCDSFMEAVVACHLREPGMGGLAFGSLPPG